VDIQVNFHKIYRYQLKKFNLVFYLLLFFIHSLFYLFIFFSSTKDTIKEKIFSIMRRYI